MSKNCMVVDVDKSTSANTAPKAPTVAGVPPFVPGMKNVTSVMLLPMGVKTLTGLNVANRSE